MSEYLCHDFKTPRTDTARRLPDTFRFIPILFYVAMLGGGYMMTMDYLSYGKAKRDKQEADDRRKALETERDGYNTELSTLETETAKAEVVAKWMEGARNMQPVVVKSPAPCSRTRGSANWCSSAVRKSPPTSA